MSAHLTPSPHLPVVHRSSGDNHASMQERAGVDDITKDTAQLTSVHGTLNGQSREAIVRALVSPPTSLPAYFHQSFVEDFKKRFWSYSTVGSNGCLVWTGLKNTKKYGVIRLAGQLFLAHRLSFLFTTGDLPADKFVCHSCDNPSCVSPDHLWLGTQFENMGDCSAKGRSRALCGENSPKSKLRSFQVVEIRRRLANGETKTQIARDFGVHRTAITFIASGKTWATGQPALASNIYNVTPSPAQLPLIQQLVSRIDDARKVLVPTGEGADDELAVASLETFAEFVTKAAEVLAKHVASKGDVA